MPYAKAWKLAFRNLLKIVWPSASLLSSPRKRMQSWMRMQGMSCEKWSVPCTIQRISETCCNSLQLRFPLCPQWNHVRTKNEILSTRSTVASITALAYSFAWCPALPALYGFMLWTKCPRNIHERSIGFGGYTDGILSILYIDWKHVMSPVSTGICLLLCLFARAVTWTACKSSMEWCWDGEKCLKFHQWNDVAIAHFASENLRSLRKSKMCHVCHMQNHESWLSATCWRSFDLQLLFFFHLASGCNLECACRECLAKKEVSPALYKEHQKLAATHCNSDFPYARNETTFAPKMKYSQLAARWPRSRP